MNSYRFDQVAATIYEFIWNEYCDWYLEFTKAILKDVNATQAQKDATSYTLVNVLESVLRMAHPVIPFITETIWQQTAPMLDRMNADKTIMTAPYPAVSDYAQDEEAEKAIAWIKEFITCVRNLRAEMKASPALTLNVMLRGASDFERNCGANYSNYLTVLSNIDVPTFVAEGENLPPCVSKPLDKAEVLIPMKDLINKEDELKRLGEMAAKLEGLIKGGEAKLQNEAFVSKAPPKIIEGAKAQVELNKEQLAKIKAQMEELNKL